MDELERRADARAQQVNCPKQHTPGYLMACMCVSDAWIGFDERLHQKPPEYDPLSIICTKANDHMRF